MSNLKNKKIKDLISKLEKDGVDVSKYKKELENIGKDLKDKKFGLIWEEHPEEVEKHLETMYVSLKEKEEKRIFKGTDFTNNFLIEGDNLESLNALKQAGTKVDVIYIDPPYNTGNEFVYNDKIVNKEDSWRHSKWLSFMEKRLRLARELMNEDGVIFVSIDDNEQAYLKVLMDHVFGEDNKIVEMKLQMRNPQRQLNAKTTFQTSIETLFVYARNYKSINLLKDIIKVDYSAYNTLIETIGDGEEFKIGKRIITRYQKDQYQILKSNDITNVNIIKPISIRGKIKTAQNSGKYYEKHLRPLISQDGNDVLYKVSDMGEDGLGYRYFTHPTNKTINGTYYQGVPISQRLDMDNAVKEKAWPDFMNYIEENIRAGNVLKDIFGEKIFDTPKPLEMMYFLLKLHPNKNAKVLDFFAGSGTTGHAVLELNKEDGGNRQFILCTNNENNICENVTYERLNKIINGYTTLKGKDVEGISANLIYLKTDFSEKENTDFIFYDENHLEHAKNVLKVKYNISEEELFETPSESLLAMLKGKDENVYIYLNDFIDPKELDALTLDETKENIIYVDSSLVNDINLAKKGFKDVKKINKYFT